MSRAEKVSISLTVLALLLTGVMAVYTQPELRRILHIPMKSEAEVPLKVDVVQRGKVELTLEDGSPFVQGSIVPVTTDFRFNEPDGRVSTNGLQFEVGIVIEQGLDGDLQVFYFADDSLKLSGARKTRERRGFTQRSESHLEATNEVRPGVKRVQWFSIWIDPKSGTPKPGSYPIGLIVTDKKNKYLDFDFTIDVSSKRTWKNGK